MARKEGVSLCGISSDIDSTFINNSEYLTYIIRFQNTGTSYAADVVIKDQLSANLDPATFIFDDASHSCIVGIDTTDMLTFRFDNIMLPDSTTNEPGSHGFVRFRIKPRVNIVENSIIDNLGQIYFDINPPVATNTVSTLYKNPVIISVSENIETQELYAFPNPAHENVNIAVTKGEQIELFNSFGQIVYSSIAEMDGNMIIPVSTVKHGMYIIRVSDKNKVLHTRIIKAD